MTITLTTIQTVPNSRPFWVKDFLFLFLFVLELLYWHRAVKDSMDCAVRSPIGRRRVLTYFLPQKLCALLISHIPCLVLASTSNTCVCRICHFTRAGVTSFRSGVINRRCRIVVVSYSIAHILDVMQTTQHASRDALRTHTRGG